MNRFMGLASTKSTGHAVTPDPRRRFMTGAVNRIPPLNPD
jgi:hypothetical protein